MAPGAFAPLTAASAGPGQPILVALHLEGGCDLLNTIVPTGQYGAYHALRKPIKEPGEKLLALNIPLARLARTAFDADPTRLASASSAFAFAPTMTALRAVYAGGGVAVVPGIGLPATEGGRFSHEVGRFDWQSGTINRTGIDANGWLGRSTLAREDSDLARLVAVNGMLPTLLRGPQASTLAIDADLASFALDVPGDDEQQADLRRRFVALQRQRLDVPGNEALRTASDAISDRINKIAQIAERVPADDYPKSDSALAQQLKTIARLILSKRGVRAYFASQAGYDTHFEQQRSHPDLLKDFSDSVAGFYRYLQAHGAARDVAIMTFTDFGRRAAGDDNFGTDHGTAAVNFIIGDRVRGGVYGEYPNLRRLDDDKNLQVTVDFRRQIAEVARFMGIDPSTVLDHDYAPLGFLN